MSGIMLSGSGNAVDALNTTYAAFKERRYETGVMRRLATKMTLKPHEGNAKNVVRYDGVTAMRLTDGVDMQQAQSFSQSVTAYIPTEVGVQVLMAKSTLRRSPDPDLHSRAGRLMNAAYDKFEDTDGTTILDGFSTSIGGAGTILSPGLIVAGITGVRVGNSTADPQPYDDNVVGVFHPCSLAALGGRLMGLASGYDITLAAAPGSAYSPNTVGGAVVRGTGATAERLLREGPKALTSLMGAPIYGDANISVDASADAKGAIFSKEGLVYVAELEPEMDPEDDKSARAIEMNLVGSFIYGLYDSGRSGVEVLTDASIPTS